DRPAAREREGLTRLDTDLEVRAGPEPLMELSKHLEVARRAITLASAGRRKRHSAIVPVHGGTQAPLPGPRSIRWSDHDVERSPRALARAEHLGGLGGRTEAVSRHPRGVSRGLQAVRPHRGHGSPPR